MIAPDSIKRLTLVLTSECNLRCDYCFENDKKSGRMDWATLRSAIDLGLRTRQPAIEFSFFGGEPLLEFDLLRRAVLYAESRRSASKQVSYGIITNGTLLSPERASFLARHEFRTLLSFDGVPAAQELRGKGTFEKLDRTLDHLRAQHSAFHDSLSVSITATPDTVRYLAESVAYFLRKRIRDINMSPIITHAAEWTVERIREIDEQFARITDMALDEYRATGETSIGNLLGGETGGGSCEKCDSTMCGVMRGE
ncbi:MAG: radical SAM protein, partial [Gemmatimonadetes bacterium]|nr:radical SAM protein [Gemmatimonadota bacterium]